jgi:hypothetical protein
MNLEVWLLVFVGGYVSLLLAIRAFTRHRAAAKQAERTLSSMLFGGFEACPDARERAAADIVLRERRAAGPRE